MLTNNTPSKRRPEHNGLNGILAFFHYLKFSISKMDIKRMSKNDFPRILLKKKAKRDLLRRMIKDYVRRTSILHSCRGYSYKIETYVK
jgi:hypothetical protein